MLTDAPAKKARVEHPDWPFLVRVAGGRRQSMGRVSPEGAVRVLQTLGSEAHRRLFPGVSYELTMDEPVGARR